MIKRAFAIGLILLCTVQIALAASDPVKLLSGVADNLLKELKQKKGEINTMSQIEATVDRFLLPHVDMNRMARYAAGRQAWLGASKDQQHSFTSAFKRLVIRTYGAALSEYTNEEIKFLPVRGGVQDKQKRVVIQSQIVRQGGQPIEVSYRLIRSGGDWKVYDFSVEGVSMIRSFQSQFASQLSAGGGLPGLTKHLNQHNNKSKKAAASS